MAGINDFLPIQASHNKISRNDELKKTTVKKKEPQADKSSPVAGNHLDQARISDTARNLLSLRMDARKYLDETKQGETLSENEIAQLKQKIENKYFVSDDVIDKIVDKLADLPNFLNTRSNTR